MASLREAHLAAALEEVLLGHLEWEEQGRLELVEMALHGEEAPLEVPQASVADTEWAQIQGYQQAAMASLMMTNPWQAVFREVWLRDCLEVQATAVDLQVSEVVVA